MAWWCITKQPFANIFLCILLIVSLTSHVFSIELNKAFQEVDEVEKMKLIRKYLLKMNKPAEKTIKSPDGDLIDCVLFHNQPAFDHPLLRKKIPKELPRRSHELNPTKSIQLWNANGEKCPEGTIPIRRITEEEVLRTTSLERFGMKPDKNQGSDFEYAFGAVGPGRYLGGSAALNLWAPEVSVRTEFSSSKIWIISGEVNVTNIEAGWLVYPYLYGDSLPRLFVYWKVESNESIGCYNLLCSGFVHTNPNVALGSPLALWSTFGGVQYQITLTINKDQPTGYWRLYWDKSEIGYWPSELFPALRGYATIVNFGGEIINSNPGGAHTMTQMGSGHFPSEGYRRAAYVAQLQIFDQNNTPTSMFNLRTEVSNPYCYNAYIPPPDHDPQLGVHILYGGPGKGPFCP